MTSKQNAEQCQLIEEARFNELTTLRSGVFTHVHYTDLYSPYDVKLLSGSTAIMGEIKVRRKNLEFFKKYAPYLELGKLKGMIQEKERIREMKNKIVSLFYFTFTSDGYCLIYPLSENVKSYSWELKSLPKDDCSGSWILKTVTVLNGPYELYRV